MKPKELMFLTLIFTAFWVSIGVVGCPGGGGGGGGEETVDTADRGQPQQGGEDPFTFFSTEEESFSVVVTSDGQPVRGARVTVTDVLTPPVESQGETIEDQILGSVYLAGVTDGAGRLTGTLKLPTRFNCVDVVVNKSEKTGPYSHEEFRELWGPFAPSSRIKVCRKDLSGVTIQLSDV